MYTKGDFHIHSTASDGDLSPKQIIIAAKESGIDIIAITDHNTTNGIKEAAETGMLYGVSVIPAIELSTRFHNNRIHLLGYFKNILYTDSTFEELIKLIKVHKINKARSILRTFVTTEIPIKTSNESCGDYLSVYEGLYLLKTFGASVVLAHPMRINKKILNEILSIPFDGIEAKYSSTSNTDTSYFINIASTRFSFYTAGSDFHTNKSKNIKHSLIGEQSLDSSEIKMFLNKSAALLL